MSENCSKCGHELPEDAVMCKYCKTGIGPVTLRAKYKDILENREINYQASEPITSDVVFRKAIYLDDVNYYGLIHGNQIMCLLRTHKLEPVVLRYLKNNSSYKPSAEGMLLRSDIKNNSTSMMNLSKSYVASMEILDYDKLTTVDMWVEIKEGGLFPYWDPTYGPDMFSRNRRASIAIFRTYEIDLPVFALETGGGRVVRPVRNPTVINNSIVETRRAILSDADYNDQREKIRNIVNKYKLFID